MDTYRKVLVLESEVQVARLGGILNDRAIPHVMRSYDDLAYGGIFQSQKGWGQIDAPEAFHDEIKSIDADLKRQDST